MISGKVMFPVDPFAALDGLSKGLRNKGIRIALNKASAVVKASVISNAPSRYGFLKKSIRIRVRNYKDKTVWLSVVGPSSSYKRTKGTSIRGKSRGEKVIHRPVKYAKLLEFGHAGKHPAKPHPFLKPALDATATQFQQTLRTAISEQVEKLLPRK